MKLYDTMQIKRHITHGCCCIFTWGVLSMQSPALSVAPEILSPMEEKIVEFEVTKLTRGFAFLTIPKHKELSKVFSFEGVTPFTEGGIEYEAFTSLGIFRIRIFGKHLVGKWLVVKSKLSLEDILLNEKNDFEAKLSPSIRERILLVGSGLVGRDIQDTMLTCYRSKSEYISVRQEILQSGRKSGVISMLIRRESGKALLEWVEFITILSE